MEDAPRYGGYDTRRPGLLAPGVDAAPGFVGGLLGVGLPSFNEQMAARDQERAAALAAGMPWGQAATRDMEAPLGLMVGMTAPSGGSSAGIRAYHASPYQFDRFRIGENLRRGEGTNMIAPGGYFAGHEPVAESYRYVAAERAQSALERYMESRRGIRLRPEEIAAELRSVPELANLADNPGVIRAVQQLTPRYPYAHSNAPVSGEEVRNFGTLSDAARRSNRGHMYEVNLRTEPGRLLDWDAPVSGQSQQVREVIETLLPPGSRGARSLAGQQQILRREPVGRQVYGALDPQAAALSSGQLSANLLRDAGIPGIQYFDQGSRAAGQGTRNYVIFPGQDEMIEILRRYGLLGPTVVGTGASLFSGQGDTQ